VRAVPGLYYVITALALVGIGAVDAAPRRALRHHPAPAKVELPENDGVRGLPHPPGPLQIADAQLEPLAWSDLDGWPQDDHAAALATFKASCRPLVRGKPPPAEQRPIYPALVNACRHALALSARTGARQFFETDFRPVRINKLGDTAGFLTGYYEPVVEGSRFPTRIFTVPVYRRPPDLVPPGGAKTGAGFPNTGKSMRRQADGTLVPYYERGEIDDGVLDGKHLEICWIKDPIDLFVIQIQGSARIRLEDGVMLRVNYDSHNGFPYTAVGRILIERKLVNREEMSMDRIREWMLANPDDGRELRRANKSYTFFRIVGLSEDQEAEGAQGIPLTAGRSIAVDKALHVYGTPIFIGADLPLADNRLEKFRRLMIAQDTGSAIVGPARADVYYGAGPEAGRVAGRFRHAGDFVMLVPRELDLAEAGAKMPVPVPRPAEADKPVEQNKGAAEASAAQPIPLPPVRPKRPMRRHG
jgi:membrane-bound lytic murein transglycosylase A